MQYGAGTQAWLQELAVLSCREFLTRHTEYADGIMSAIDAERIRRHLVECSSCARYNSVVREGAKLFTSQPVVQPDATFMDQLHSRIADEEHRMTMRPVSANAAAYVSIAAVLALVVWAPRLFVDKAVEEGQYTTTSSSLRPKLTSTEIAWRVADAFDNGRMRRGAYHSTRPENHTAVSLVTQRYTPLIVDAPTAPPSYARVSFTAYDAR